MELPFKIVVNSEEETQKVAQEFAKSISNGAIIAITGNLGTGKTYFVKSFAKHFEIENVTSPTFAIVNSYFGKTKIHHFDFYRIKKMEELYDIGFEEYLCDNSAITIIEWAEMFEKILPQNIFRIEISHLGNSKREIIIKKK